MKVSVMFLSPVTICAGLSTCNTKHTSIFGVMCGIQSAYDNLSLHHNFAGEHSPPEAFCRHRLKNKMKKKKRKTSGLGDFISEQLLRFELESSLTIIKAHKKSLKPMFPIERIYNTRHTINNS